MRRFRIQGAAEAINAVSHAEATSARLLPVSKRGVRQAVIVPLVFAAVWAWLPLVGCGYARSGAPASPLKAGIAEIEAGRLATPLIGEPTATGDRTVTFLARRDGDRVPRIVSDVTGWGERLDGTFDLEAGTMMRVEGTDWYSLEASVAARARIEYLVAYGPDDYRLDPHNVRPALEQPPASEFVMPDFVPPQELVDPSVAPAGLVTEAAFTSRALSLMCRLVVYTPPAYRRNGSYPLAVFADRPAGPVPRVLDRLIARRAITPIVAVFPETGVHGSNRVTDDQMSAFLTRELLAWLAPRYSVTRNAGQRAIIGISFSAKDALAATFVSPQAFGRLGLLIPGRRITQADLDSIAVRRAPRLRAAILAGRYDSANIATARGVRQALADAGHLVDYVEVPEGHTPRTWRNHLGEVLTCLFGSPDAGEGR